MPMFWMDPDDDVTFRDRDFRSKLWPFGFGPSLIVLAIVSLLAIAALVAAVR